MDSPKSLIRRIFDLVLLAGMAAGLVWVVSLVATAPQNTLAPAAVQAVESPYPPPPTATPLPTVTPTPPPPYPAPGEGLNPSPTPNYCTGLGTWLTFTDPVAGYTISYPGEALVPPVLLNTPKADNYYHSFNFNIWTDCYNVGCSGLNSIGITVYPNPNGLELQPFIEQTFHLYDSPEIPVLTQNYEETGYFTRVGVEQDLRAFRIEKGVLLNEGVNVFIENADKVILIWSSRTSKGIMPPFDSPCIKTLEILDLMLNTLVLTLPSQ